MGHILIVEDDVAIAAFLARGLGRAGFATTTIDNGRAAAPAALSGAYALVILDLGLPDVDGLDVLRSVRRAGCSVPVIILSARSSVPETVAGLESGADDYMPKPFSFGELLARVRLRLRPPEADPVVLSHGELTLDLRTRRFTVEGREVDLTAREFALAEAFLRRPTDTLSREELLSQVWGYEFDPGSNVVEVYVRYLRRKLGARHFLTVRGLGYRLA